MQPVIIIGAARSGTKFFRDLLGSSEDVAVVPYDINYVWRHGNESLPHDELTPQSLTPRTARHIRSSIERLAERNAGRKPLLVEKTVSNSVRIDFVRAVYPDAKIIHLERNGLDAVESTYRQWTESPDHSYLLQKLRYFPFREWRYALWFARNTLQRGDDVGVWGVRYDGIDADLERLDVAEVCAHQWRRANDQWQQRSAIPELELECRYADLFSDPDTELSRVCEFLSIDTAPVAERFKATSRPVYDSFPGAIPPSREASVRTIVEGGR